MVQLVDEDIKTREVLDWQGLHVLHNPLSSCSQKLRVFLSLKGLEWQSHIIDLPANENLGEWFLGINPRGLVPVLIHNGVVHIESNDILTYLEKTFQDSGPQLIPEGSENEVDQILQYENDLHMDLRALSFRFVFAPPHAPKSADELDRFATTGSGTVLGQKDNHKDAEIEFWKQYAALGISDEYARSAAAKFRKIFDDLDRNLAHRPYLLGNELSVLDIAWFIYINRLILAGYPLERLHPALAEWFAKLKTQPAFAREIQLPPALKKRFDTTREQHLREGVSLETVAGL